MAMLTNQDLDINSNLVLLDDGAPYAGMGLVKLEKLARIIMPGWDGALGALPDKIKARPFWQYGRGKHTSKARRILGTGMLTIDSDQGDPLSINHLVIEGSSPWVVGRNVTTKRNIIHASGDYLQFFQPDGNELTLDLIEHDMHSYLPRSKFYHDAYISTHDPTSAALCNFSVTMNWKDTKKIIDRVHAHVCGHSNYNDISLLLKRNQLWDDHCVDYISELLQTCPHCHVVDTPAGRRPVSLSTISREFHDTVAVDHYHLDGLNIFHCMDVSTRYSAGAVVESTAMTEAIEEFETTWIKPFWSPGAVQGDKAFDNATFREYLLAHDIDFRPVPPRRHNKNAIESRNRILRNIYMRLRHANPTISPKLLIA